MSTLETSIREALAEVADPATELKITGSGQLLEVLVDEDARTAGLTISVISPGYPHRDALDHRVRAALEPLKLAQLQVEYTLRVVHRPARADLNRLPTVKNIIAVAAGKGGVGKSTTTVNLAFALDKLGAKVGILDGDIYGPSIPKMLGAADSEAESAEGGSGIVPARYRGMPVMSVQYFVEPGQAVIWRGPMIHKLLTQFLEDVQWGELDYLLVDLPPGTGDAQLSLAQLIPINGAVMVTTPQDVAVLDVRKAINMFEKLEVPLLGVVENMSFYRCPACGHHDEVFGAGGGKTLAQDFNTQLLGQVPIDPRIAFGGEAGKPLVEVTPDSEQARTFFDIAAQATLQCAKSASHGPRRSTKLRTL